MIRFTFTGKLKLIPESEKFIPYEMRKFDSGWTRRQLSFNGIDGDNRHMFTISGGHFPDKGAKDVVISISPSERDESGNIVEKGGRIEIPWKDRLLQKSIDSVADFRKCTLDLEQYGRRRLLQTLADKIHEGATVSDEDLKAVGLTDESQVADALEESNKLRSEFISEWDFAEAVYNAINSGKYNNTVFTIKGTIECQWGDAKQKWYETMKPQRIYVAKSDAEESCVGSTTVYFTSDAVDDNDVDSKGKYYIKAFTMEYNNGTKCNVPHPIQIVIPRELPSKETDSEAKPKKQISPEDRAKHLVSKFIIDDDSVKEFGVEFDILDGAQKVEVDESMLTPEQLEDLEFGLITMEDIRNELGGTVYGDRVIENRYRAIVRGYTKGAKDTKYSPEDLIFPKKEEIDDKELDTIFNVENLSDEDDEDDL